MSSKTTEITRKDLIIKAKKAGIKDFDEMSDTKLVNACNKYLKKRKSHNIYKKFSQTAQRNIKKRTNPTKIDLCKAQTLRNKSLDVLEDNCMKYINVSTDNELKEKINQIRILLTKLLIPLQMKRKI